MRWKKQLTHKKYRNKKTIKIDCEDLKRDQKNNFYSDERASRFDVSASGIRCARSVQGNPKSS